MRSRSLEHHGNPMDAPMGSYARLKALDFARIRQTDTPFSQLDLIDRREFAVEVVPRLLVEAQRSRELAVSHRDFRVGAAAVVLYWREGVERQLYIHGANMKPLTEGGINVHSEHVIMNGVMRHMRPGDTVSVPAIAIVGDYQDDQWSGLATRTLHPCGVCRDDLTSFEGAVFDETIFAMADPGLTTIELSGLTELRSFHDGLVQNIAHAKLKPDLEVTSQGA